MAIRSDTDPKNPASRPGAQRAELDQYGVWVKAEPRDIVEDAAASLPDESDFEPGQVSPPSPEESFLSAEEEKMLGSFDAEFDSLGSEADQMPLPDIEDIPALEESLLDIEKPRQGGMEDIEDLESSTVDISLEELEGAAEGTPISPYAEIDLESIQGLDAPSAVSSSASFSMEDVSAEFLDNLEEAPAAESSEASFESHDVTAEFLDTAEPARSEKAEEPAPEFESLDMDLTFDDTLPSEEKRSEADGAEDVGLDGFEEVTEFDDFLAEPEAETSPSPSAASVAPSTEEFDDLSAVERELSSPAPSEPTRGRSLDSSSEILLKIADELSSIRGELVSLKKQLKEYRHEEPSPVEDKGVQEESAAPGGFFDEEEDETIALTGDELDNILNTADFTEEEAAGAEGLGATLPELGENAAAPGIETPQDIEIIDESILPEGGDYSSAAIEPAIEELRLGESVDIEQPSDESAAKAPEFEEISLMAEEGVRPMTPAPEDTSYLESALGADDAEFGEAIPTDVPLVEPDLSDFDLEVEELESEPTIEIDEELPVVEQPSEESIEELTLSVESGPDYAEAKPLELETLEALPEIEESELQDINLHHEGLSTTEVEDFAEIEELPGSDDDTLAAEIETKTVKPAEPFSLHPDELPSSLDDRYFIGGEALAGSEVPEEAEEEFLLDLEEETSEQAPASRPVPAPVELPEAVEVPEAEELAEIEEEPSQAAVPTAAAKPAPGDDRLKSEIRSVLAYLDKLLDSLPEDKIEEFARSQYFDTYKRLFEELGLV